LTLSLTGRRDPDLAIHRHRHHGFSSRVPIVRALPYMLVTAMKGLVPDLELMAQE
jgi:hypothetical protein